MGKSVGKRANIVPAIAGAPILGTAAVKKKKEKIIISTRVFHFNAIKNKWKFI